MRYGADHKEQTRKRVLRAAAKAIRIEGPHRVAVAGVMAKVGLTHGGFYAHFKSKDDLVAASIGQMFEEGRERARRETEGVDPATGLSQYIDFYLLARTPRRPRRRLPAPLSFGRRAADGCRFARTVRRGGGAADGPSGGPACRHGPPRSGPRRQFAAR